MLHASSALTRGFGARRRRWLIVTRTWQNIYMNTVSSVDRSS